MEFNNLTKGMIKALFELFAYVKVGEVAMHDFMQINKNMSGVKEEGQNCQMCSGCFDFKDWSSLIDLYTTHAADFQIPSILSRDFDTANNSTLSS